MLEQLKEQLKDEDEAVEYNLEFGKIFYDYENASSKRDGSLESLKKATSEKYGTLEDFRKDATLIRNFFLNGTQIDRQEGAVDLLSEFGLTFKNQYEFYSHCMRNKFMMIKVDSRLTKMMELMINNAYKKRKHLEKVVFPASIEKTLSLDDSLVSCSSLTMTTPTAPSSEFCRQLQLEIEQKDLV